MPLGRAWSGSERAIHGSDGDVLLRHLPRERQDNLPAVVDADDQLGEFRRRSLASSERQRVDPLDADGAPSDEEMLSTDLEEMIGFSRLRWADEPQLVGCAGADDPSPSGVLAREPLG